MKIEPVPVIGARGLIPGPVRPLGVDEDDTGAGIFVVVVRPDIKVAVDRPWLGVPRALEPRMLVRGMVDHQLDDHPHAALMRRRDEAFDIGQRAVVRIDPAIVGDVVAVIQLRRRIERQQPDRVHPQLGDIVQPRDQAREIANAVVVRIKERFDVQLIDDRVLVPQRGRSRRPDRYVAANADAGRSFRRLQPSTVARCGTANPRDRAECAGAFHTT